MAIHGWGAPLWASEIIGEFGSSGSPMWLSNYYRGGAHVQDVASNNNISTNGYIAHSMFYGAGNPAPLQAISKTIFKAKIYFFYSFRIWFIFNRGVIYFYNDATTGSEGEINTPGGWAVYTPPAGMMNLNFYGNHYVDGNGVTQYSGYFANADGERVNILQYVPPDELMIPRLDEYSSVTLTATQSQLQGEAGQGQESNWFPYLVTYFSFSTTSGLNALQNQFFATSNDSSLKSVTIEITLSATP